MPNQTKLSIAIVSWNTKDLLHKCLESITSAVDNISYEVIVVDNASYDGSAQMVSSNYPDVLLIENENNLGFAKANNQAFSVSTGEYFMLLNSDTICLQNSLSKLTKFMDLHTEIGVCGPLVLNEDKTLQYSWAAFPTISSEISGRLNRRIDSIQDIPMSAEAVKLVGAFRTDWVGGCAFVARRNAIDKVGLLDEKIFMYSEETDWCKRFKDAGFEIWIYPQSEIIHLGGKSSDQAPKFAQQALSSSKIYYFKKHHGFAAAIILVLIYTLKTFIRNLRGK